MLRFWTSPTPTHHLVVAGRHSSLNRFQVLTVCSSALVAALAVSHRPLESHRFSRNPQFALFLWPPALVIALCLSRCFSVTGAQPAQVCGITVFLELVCVPENNLFFHVCLPEFVSLRHYQKFRMCHVNFIVYLVVLKNLLIRNSEFELFHNVYGLVNQNLNFS